MKTPPRVIAFGWIVLLGGILTMDNLRRCKVIVVNASPTCLANEESIDHLLLNCSLNQRIWRSIFSWFKFCGPLPNSTPSLFGFWRLGVGSKRGQVMWKLSFSAAIWSLWKERNLRCFEGKSSVVSKIVDNVKHLVALWACPLPLFKGILISSILLNWDVVALSRTISRHFFPRWHPPPHGVLNLNFDGSTSGNPGMASVGGVIHYEDGNIILFYSSSASVCSINKVKLLALNIGLQKLPFLFPNGSLWKGILLVLSNGRLGPLPLLGILQTL